MKVERGDVGGGGNATSLQFHQSAIIEYFVAGKKEASSNTTLFTENRVMKSG